MKQVRLKDVVASLESGARPKGGVTSSSGDIPSFGGEHVAADGSLILSNVKRIPKSFYDNLRSGQIRPRDILVVKDGATTGKTGFVRDDFPFRDAAVNEHLFIVRVNREKAEASYIYHFLRSPFGQSGIRQDFRGATVGGISRGFVDRVFLPLPPLPEQRRIAAILDQADSLRAMRRSARLKLDSFKQALFVAMFGDPTNNPKGWPLVSLKDGCDEINDCPHSTPHWTPSGVICLRTSNLLKGEWFWEDTRYVTEAAYHERSKRGYLKSGDIVISREGTVGVAAILPDGIEACMGQRLVQIRTSPNKFLPAYLLHHLLHVLEPERIARSMVGSTSHHLNVGALRALRIPVPPLAEQDNFSRRIEECERLRSSSEQSLAGLDGLFSSLQHRAFRGEL